MISRKKKAVSMTKSVMMRASRERPMVGGVRVANVRVGGKWKRAETCGNVRVLLYTRLEFEEASSILVAQLFANENTDYPLGSLALLLPQTLTLDLDFFRVCSSSSSSSGDERDPKPKFRWQAPGGRASGGDSRAGDRAAIGPTVCPATHHAQVGDNG